MPTRNNDISLSKLTKELSQKRNRENIEPEQFSSNEKAKKTEHSDSARDLHKEQQIEKQKALYILKEAVEKEESALKAYKDALSESLEKTYLITGGTGYLREKAINNLEALKGKLNLRIIHSDKNDFEGFPEETALIFSPISLDLLQDLDFYDAKCMASIGFQDNNANTRMIFKDSGPNSLSYNIDLYVFKFGVVDLSNCLGRSDLRPKKSYLIKGGSHPVREVLAEKIIASLGFHETECFVSPRKDSNGYPEEIVVVSDPLLHEIRGLGFEQAKLFASEGFNEVDTMREISKQTGKVLDLYLDMMRDLLKQKRNILDSYDNKQGIFDVTSCDAEAMILINQSNVTQSLNNFMWSCHESAINQRPAYTPTPFTLPSPTEELRRHFANDPYMKPTSYSWRLGELSNDKNGDVFDPFAGSLASVGQKPSAGCASGGGMFSSSKQEDAGGGINRCPTGTHPGNIGVRFGGSGSFTYDKCLPNR